RTARVVRPTPTRSGSTRTNKVQPERSGGNPEKHQGCDAGQPERSGGNPEKRQRVRRGATGAQRRESREAPRARRGTAGLTEFFARRVYTAGLSRQFISIQVSVCCDPARGWAYRAARRGFRGHDFSGWPDAYLSLEGMARV